MKKGFRILTLCLLGVSLIIMEVPAQNVLDGIYIKEHTPTRKVVPYSPLREADVLYSKKVWRMLDMREKVNHALYFPVEEIRDRQNLFHVIKKGLLEEGSLTAYDPGPLLEDDEFKVAMLPSEVRQKYITIDTTDTEDLDTGELTQVIQELELEPSDVKKYQLKEVWYFDKQRAKLEVRIVGIAPMITVRGEDGEVRGEAPMFWLYFPECRYVFANYDIFNRHNDTERCTYDDFFWKRMFSSYIVKESNVYNRKIHSYATGVDALLESERIKNEIFEFEHDLWEF